MMRVGSACLATALCTAFFLILAPAGSAETTYQTTWVSQFGTSGFDYAYGLCGDSLGNVYVGGLTGGSLAGKSAGEEDAFIRKIDPAGNTLWTCQFGSGSDEWARSIAADGSGGVYATGSTRGALEGVSYGGQDAFLSRFDSSGSHLWTRQFGTAELEFSNTVGADKSGNVYVGGFTRGSLAGPAPQYGEKVAFLAKYDVLGSSLWVRQFDSGSTADNEIACLAVNAKGSVYVCGTGSLDGPRISGKEIFLSKHDASGNVEWIRNIGTPQIDNANAVAVDDRGNVFLAGASMGALGGPNAGERDAFLCRYDEAGNLIWTRQFGTSQMDSANSLATDGFGNVYVAGITFDGLGEPGAGMSDCFVAKFDEEGNLLWTRLLGTPTSDWASAVWADEYGRLYIAGNTVGSMAGFDPDLEDAFVAQLTVPEPSTLGLLALGVAALFRRKSKKGSRNLFSKSSKTPHISQIREKGS